MDRRKFLNKSLATGLLVSTIPSLAGKNTDRQKLFRIAHITDTHIFPSDKVKKAISRLIEEIQTMKEKPDFVLHTGDHIMDSLKKPKEDVHKQWQSWTEYFKNKLDIPMYFCIGNHDVWGWGLEDEAVKRDPLFGKSWAMSMLGLSERYYSFENKGWKFICLDSPYYVEEEHTYTAKLDEGQFEWLRSELQNTNTKTPVCIASHIPILSASVFYDGDNAKSGDWEVPGAWMHIDSKQIKDLFYKYPNVKAALSGHVHLADKTEYLGVDYHCNGAACGGWWNGDYQEFGTAYAIVDFYDDGTINTELIPYQF
jgi:3',5'-cyclic AMP phosphodiesterase CpdA